MYSVVFVPLIASDILLGLCGVGVLLMLLTLWRGGVAAPLRALTYALVLLALANPSLKKEERDPLADIVAVIVDRSSSQTVADRPNIIDASLADLTGNLEQFGDVEIRQFEVKDASQNRGTLLSPAINKALAEIPRNRLAAIYVLSDGQIADEDLPQNIGVPIHTFITGRETEWDRRLIIKTLPSFAILGEEFKLELRVEDFGAFEPEDRVRLDIAIDGNPSQSFEIPMGVDMELPLTLDRAGINVIRFSTPEVEGELTGLNNASMVQINGVRDRLRVLLVSGEPHAGARTWRNLLKSDPAVDLVHFTILRPPEKQDGTPVDELSLIAFPTRELFLQKIDEFDLIIFDRYKRRGILPAAYFENIVNYVEKGGAVLVAAGPDFAGVNSLYRSPFARMLPAQPTAQIIDDPFQPQMTDKGKRHPVTADLPEPENWGRWYRQIELTPTAGDVVLGGYKESPLLILSRFGRGRVALLGSDHAWLWERGVEGGGPQRELLRRIAHWSMAEPDLEEEYLRAVQEGDRVKISRTTLQDDVEELRITGPSGEETTHQMTKTRDGLYEYDFTGNDLGFYRVDQGEQSFVFGLGPAAPREYEETLASEDRLGPWAQAALGGVFWVAERTPDIRLARVGRLAAGPTWSGVLRREAYQVRDLKLYPLTPAWLVLLIIAGLAIATWLREGRRG